jgi:hypothetical protein
MTIKLACSLMLLTFPLDHPWHLKLVTEGDGEERTPSWDQIPADHGRLPGGVRTGAGT